MDQTHNSYFRNFFLQDKNSESRSSLLFSILSTHTHHGGAMRAMSSSSSSTASLLLSPTRRAVRQKPNCIIISSSSSSSSSKQQQQPHDSRRHSRRLLLLSIPISASLLPATTSSSSAADDSFDPVSDSEKKASAELSRRISEAIRLLDLGRDSQAQGNFARALDYFTQVVNDYKDFALTDYARVGRALALYEIGNRDEAIAEMEDVSSSLKGYPEVHAALAAALYVDKHAPLLAENQFNLATLLDPHYTDLSYVRETKHWPPSLVSSLRTFITLS